MKVYYVGENRKGYKYVKMYINVMRVWVWNTIKLCMYKKILCMQNYYQPIAY